MSSNLPSESPKHRIEFTGNSAPKKRRKPLKPPPKWIVGWFGGVLLFFGGGALGGFGALALLWMMLSATDDIDNPFMAIVSLFLALFTGAVAGSGAGMLIWFIVGARAPESDGLD